MKNIVSLLFVFGVISPAAAAPTIPWWERPTICQLSDESCWGAAAGQGINDEWDDKAACKGKKIICANAIIGGASKNEAFSKSEISSAEKTGVGKIDSDFDVYILDSREKDDQCFGVRRTQNNGTSAKVSGAPGGWVNVYCMEVPGNFDEELAGAGEHFPYGQIVTAPAKPQPNCESLKGDGFMGILNGRCYGRDGYPDSDYFLECDSSKPSRLLPTTIVILNGADINDIKTSPWGATPPASSYPTTEQDADARFNAMIKMAAEKQRDNAP